MTNKTYATAVKWISYTLLFLSIPSLFLKWIVPGSVYRTPIFMSHFFSPNNSNISLINTMPLPHRFFGICIEAVAVGLIIYALITIIGIVGSIERGEYFSSNIAVLFKRLSICMFLFVLYAPINEALMSVITSWHRGPGNRFLSITFGTPELENILLFCLLMIIATLMQKGAELQRESDLTV